MAEHEFSMPVHGQQKDATEAEGLKEAKGTKETTFAATLRNFRETKGIQQQALASQIGKSPSLLSLIENGQRLPTPSFIRAVGRALDLSSEEEHILLHSAGYRADQTNVALNTLVNSLDKTYQLTPDERALVLQELSTTLSSWQQLFENRQLLFNQELAKARKGFWEMRGHREYSLTLRTAVRKYLADTLFEMGYLARAKRYAAKALTLFKRLPPRWASSLQAETYATQSMIALREGRYTDARALVDRSMQLYNQFLVGPTINEELAHLGLGRSYKRMAQISLFAGEFDVALGYCSEAEAHLRLLPASANRDTWLRRIQELRAWAFSKKGYFERAVQLYQETLEQCQKAGDQSGLTKNQLYLGDAHLRQLQALLKEAHWEDKAEPAERRDIVRTVVESNRPLLDQAEHYYQLARQALEKNRILLGQCLLNLGSVLRLKGSAMREEDETERKACYHRAEEDLLAALLLERQIGLSRRLPNIYEAFAELFWEWGTEWDNEQTAQQGQQNHTAGCAGWKAQVIHYTDLAYAALATPLVTSGDPSGQRLYARLQSAQNLLQKARPSDQRDEQTKIIVVNWTDDMEGIDIGAPPEWRILCEKLVSTLQKYRPQLARALIATSPTDQLWVQKMAEFERLPGSRLLAQNELSSSLSLNLPTGYSSWNVPDHLNRYWSFRENLTTYQQLDKASSQTVQNGSISQDTGNGSFAVSRDLYCRQTIEESLRKQETHSLTSAQVQEALVLVDKFPQMYRIDSSWYALPLAFEVKAGEVLLQIPYPLTKRFDPDRTTGPQDQLCYHIQSSAGPKERLVNASRDELPPLASALTGIFEELTKESAKLLQQLNQLQSTRTWLQDLKKDIGHAAAIAPSL